MGIRIQWGAGWVFGAEVEALQVREAEHGEARGSLRGVTHARVAQKRSWLRQQTQRCSCAVLAIGVVQAEVQQRDLEEAAVAVVAMEGAAEEGWCRGGYSSQLHSRSRTTL